MGDVVDARDNSVGAWFEAKIVKITKDEKFEAPPKTNPDDMETDDGPPSHDGYIYSVVFDGQVLSICKLITCFIYLCNIGKCGYFICTCRLKIPFILIDCVENYPMR